ncbi:MAG TPA: regulatory iron-sulfur-containing complex subunit RicT [Flavobacteriaceae bacterium]|nr:regulatory iron-sulfur-containing complex subunit RicT [Flavobacteriaceae bacterium]
MGCTSCSTGTTGMPPGCKNNGVCGTDGCNKLTVFDWLSNMALPANADPFNALEVRFKNGRKEFFRNPDNLKLYIGDVVATEAGSGHDIGVVTLTGELVRVQMKKKKVPLKLESLPKVYRKANQKDIDLWQELRSKESQIQKESREIAIRLNLEMKISDVEYQGDGSKVVFYYTADERVDFRELIKEFARSFHTRIEMKQIGFRQEAARLGGIGSCGRELCCSTWLTDFRSVNTSAARYQQLSLNPQKLAGQCGKLKCCLNYELDTYLEALKSFPSTDIKLATEKGVAACQKIDIFRGRLWYAYENDGANWHELTVEHANDIIAKNKSGEKPASLEEFAITKDDKGADTLDIAAQDSLTRFDKSPSKGRKRKTKSAKPKEKPLPTKKTQQVAPPQAKEGRPKKQKKFRKPRKKNE